MPPKLSVQSLLQTASEQTGLSDFGDDLFLEPLSKLLDALDKEAALSNVGEVRLQQMYIALLVNRLRFEDDLKRHPEILEQKLAPPIVVVGLPRSGTTKLHRVLAAHPEAQFLPHWQIMNPAPFPGGKSGDDDPRIAYAEAVISAMAESHPDTLAGHPMDAREAEEESQVMMEMTFDGALIPVRANVPSFASWRWKRSMLPCYQYFYRLLQYIQWQRRTEPRPFVLKNPLHLGHIDALAEVFPGATVVHCHRDPVASVPSFARLTEAGWAMISDRSVMSEFGQASLELLGSHIDRYLRLRPTTERKLNFVDVSFKDIVDDAVAIAQQVYRSHGLTSTPDIEARIRDWEDRNPATLHGKHAYSLEQYHLSTAQIRDRFNAYYDCFGTSLGVNEMEV